MKKLILLLTVFSLSLIFSACSSEKSSNDKEKKDSGNKDEVTISVASWRLGPEEDNNLERQMIKAFEEEYPHINVEINESIADPWNDSLATAASAGKLPDVFEISNIPVSLSNDWLYDVSDLVEGDEDFEKISESVKQSLTHEDSVIALPSGQHFLGYYVNKSLYDEANLNAPEYGMTIDEFSNSVRDISDINNGVIGLNQPFSLVEWYPVAANDDMGIFTYKDGQVNLNSNEFISGVNFANSLVSNNYVFTSLTDDQKSNFNGENPVEVWGQGDLGLRWDGTWAVNAINESSDFEWDFIGIPGGKTVVVNDFMGISKSTEHPEEAYLFTKFMTFGKEGYMKRLEIADEKGITLSSLPISTDQEILDEFFSRMDVPGVLKAYENIDDAVVNLPKIVPGYTEARWEAPTGVSISDEIPNATIGQLIDASVKGDVKIEDYISQVNEMSNKKLQEGSEALN
jgi:multiple sugar transport system substrate-binding protein